MEKLHQWIGVLEGQLIHLLKNSWTFCPKGKLYCIFTAVLTLLSRPHTDRSNNEQSWCLSQRSSLLWHFDLNVNCHVWCNYNVSIHCLCTFGNNDD